MGTAYKVQDYVIAIFGSDWLSWTITLPLAVMLGLMEFCIGIYLFFGIRRHWTSRIAVALMAFYTPLTLWIAITDAVPDCGCFGDAVHLTGWQTFSKNVVMLALCIVAFKMRKHFTRFISEKMQWLISLYSIVYGLFLAGLCIYTLPIIDFRPYHIGQNIPKAMEWPDDPQQLPEIIDFDFDGAEDIISDTSYTFLLVAPSLETADDGAMDRINALTDYAKHYKYTFLCLTGSGDEAIARWQDLTGSEYPFTFADPLLLKTMVRSNPGLMLIHNGTIVNKWSAETMPIEEELTAPLYQLDMAHLQPQSYRNKLLYLLLWYLVPLMLITFTDRVIAGTKWWKRRKAAMHPDLATEAVDEPEATQLEE